MPATTPRAILIAPLCLYLTGCIHDEDSSSPAAPAVIPGTALNDTGVTTCADEFNNALACPTATHPRQDAEFGRDASNNDDTDGRAGFSFTKLADSGAELEASATDWDCVRDNTTGLVWEVKDPTINLRTNTNTYTWYDAGNNSVLDGYRGGGNCNGITSCDTQSYIDAINSAGLCNFSDWRLPSREELRSIVDYSASPAIDSDYFPYTANPDRANLQHGDWYWTSQSHAANENYAWLINFNYGGDGPEYKYSPQLIRLVRGN